jgi:SAM-dependent methyltransferase
MTRPGITHPPVKDIKELFTDIYKMNAWGGEPGTFYSGKGTHHPKTIIYMKNIIRLIKSNNIRSVLDIGCGDFTMMSKVLKLVDVYYTGVDLVEEMIRHHQEAYRNASTRFMVLDAVVEELPEADMVTVRQVLQHLSNIQIQQILNKLRRFRYVLITEHMLSGDAVVPNLDQLPGQHNRSRLNSGVFIDKPPFNIMDSRILFEYRADEKVDNKIYPAVMRTYLIENRP